MKINGMTDFISHHYSACNFDVLECLDGRKGLTTKPAGFQA